MTKTARTVSAAAIRYARERLGWSRADLAKQLHDHNPEAGWNEGRVIRLELDRGQPTPNELVDLSDVLGASLDFLIRGADLAPTGPREVTGRYLGSALCAAAA